MDSQNRHLKLAKSGLEVPKPQPKFSGEVRRSVRDVARDAGGTLSRVPAPTPQEAWGNADNQSYYDSISSGKLETRAKSIGLDRWADLELLKPEIFSIIPERLLEIGPGYGRVLRWLSKHLSGLETIAVEWNEGYAKRLSKEFKRFSQIQILNQNIFDVQLDSPVQFAFLLWSTFAEFNPEEKAKLFKKVRGLLAPGGRLAIDFPRLVQGEASASVRGGDFLQYRDEYGRLSVHLQNDQEIFDMARDAGFSQWRRIEYRSDAGLPRVLFVLHN